MKSNNMSSSNNDDLSELSIPFVKYVEKVEIKEKAIVENPPIQELEVE